MRFKALLGHSNFIALQCMLRSGRTITIVFSLLGDALAVAPGNNFLILTKNAQYYAFSLAECFHGTFCRSGSHLQTGFLVTKISTETKWS